MKIHHLRNATLILETAQHHILVDPALDPVGTIPPLSIFRSKAKRNPMVPLPANAQAQLDKVTHCLITHRHPDHLDPSGMDLLRSRDIPVYCSEADAPILRKKGLNVMQAFDYGRRYEFLGGTLEGIPALHGYGFVARLMGKVMGFYLAWPNEPSVYISSDTIYTPAVHRVLTELRPKIAVVAAGGAQLDVFKPLLMDEKDVLKFVKNAPHAVLANHMDAINHCRMTRSKLRQALQQQGLEERVWIPEDGAAKTFE